MLLSIAKAASKHGIAPLKKYGQNFIFDQSLCDKIVRVAGDINKSQVLEIGPGPAGLTRSILAANPPKLTVIETDKRCLPLLEEIKQYYPALEIINADALKISLTELSDKNDKITIISNLPYNIGTAILINYLKQIEHVHSMTFMLQKEVVDRIVALPGSSQYGRLSVLCQIICHTQKCFDVSPKAFYPEPKIWSSIVHLVPKENQLSPNILEALEKVTMAAFIKRRKMIKSSLKSIFQDVESVLDHLGINKSLRAENLTPQNYLDLAKVLIS